jgi:hypothetical protein
MWIKMTQTHTGVNGIYIIDQKYDLPDAIVKSLPTDCYKKTCAPWAEYEDKNTVEMVQAKTKAHESKIFADLAQDKADRAREAADKLVPVVDAKQAEDKEAGAKAKDATAKSKAASQKAKKAGASQGDKKRAKKLTAEAWLLSRSHERKFCEFQKAQGQLQVALAEHGLLQLDADQAKRNAAAAAKELENLEAKIADAKAKAESEKPDGPEEQKEPAEGGPAKTEAGKSDQPVATR